MSDDLLERLDRGVLHCGLHDDNETELFEVDDANDTMAEAKAEIEKLREALEAVWKEATTMRTASKLVGPYPTQPEKNRLWARSMYHAGKRIMEMLKPIRAALGETK